MEPTSPTFVPPRFSERSFRTYEPFIAMAVAAWPRETQFLPETMLDLTGRRISPHTFVARIRDAITALKRFKYETTAVNTDKLWSMSGSYVLAYGTEGSVWLRARGQQGRPTGLIGEARERGNVPPAEAVPAFAQASVKAVWSEVDGNTLDALCRLVNAGYITGPVVLQMFVAPETIEHYEAKYNVTLTPHEGTTIVL